MANDTFSVDWMQGWTDLQRKIWNEWVAMAGEHLHDKGRFPGIPGTDNTAPWSTPWFQAMGAAPSAWGNAGMGQAAPWAMPWLQQPSGFGSGPASGIEQWMRHFGMRPQETTPEAVVVNNMVSATEGFMRISKEIFQALQKMGEGVRNGEEWTTLLSNSIEQAKELFGGPWGTQASIDPMAAWSQPLQKWMEMLKDSPMFSNPLMQSFLGTSSGFPGSSGFSGTPDVEAWFGQFLGMPGLGITREKQERIQAGVRDGLLYQKAFQAFQELSKQVNLRALDLLHKKLLERGASNEPLGSLRDLYVLWVDCSEEANAEFIRGEAYQEASSRMTNALMRVQGHVQTMVDEVLESFRMPTRREVDRSHRQMQEMKRRLRSLEDELKTLRTKDHTAELAAIRDDLERLDVRNLRQELSAMKKHLELSLPANGQSEKKVTKPRSALAPREKGSGPQPSAQRVKGGNAPYEARAATADAKKGE